VWDVQTSQAALVWLPLVEGLKEEERLQLKEF